MGSVAVKMFKPRAVLHLLFIMLDCLVQITESKSTPDGIFIIPAINKTSTTSNTTTSTTSTTSKTTEIQDTFPPKYNKTSKQDEEFSFEIDMGIHPGHGLCTKCWWETSFYNCNDPTSANLERCRRQVCPRCHVD